MFYKKFSFAKCLNQSERLSVTKNIISCGRGFWLVFLDFNLSSQHLKGGWIRGRSRRSTGNRLQHQEAHPAGVHLSDDHPHVVQQQREVHLWGTQLNAPLLIHNVTVCYSSATKTMTRQTCKFQIPAFLSSVLDIVSSWPWTRFSPPCRRSSRRRTSRRGSWCERCSLWPVGSPLREFSPKSQSPRKLRTDMCLQSTTSLPPNCTVSRSRQVHKTQVFIMFS